MMAFPDYEKGVAAGYPILIIFSLFEKMFKAKIKEGGYKPGSEPKRGK